MFRRVLDSAKRTDRARQAARRRAVFALEGLESRRVLSTFTWTGNAGTAWSTSGNWLKEGQATSSVPGLWDDVVFDGTADVAANVTASTTVNSLTIGAGYDGTITLGEGVHLKAAEKFSLTSGTFDGGAGTLTSGEGFTVAGGNFVAGAGTLVLQPEGSGPINAPGVQFNNVTIDFGSHHINVGGGLNVNGSLQILGAQQLTGVIYARGDVSTSATAIFSKTAADKIVIGGNGNRTLAGIGTEKAIGGLPNVEINRQGGTLTISDKIKVRGNWTHVKGVVAAADSTVIFKTRGTVDTNTMAFGNVAIDADDHHFYVKRLNVGGDLTIQSIQTIGYSGGAGTGAITVGRNLTSNDDSVIGDADITLTGATDAVIRGGDFPDGGIIIAKKSGAAVTAGVLRPLDGPLSLNSLASLKGEFQVGRNVSTRAFNASGNADGSPVLIFKGDRAQTLTYFTTTNPNNQAVVDARVPGLGFDKTGGSVKFVKGAGAVAPDALAVTGGWIVSDNNAAAIDLAGHDIAFILSGGYGHRTINTGPSAGFDGVELATGSGSTVTAAKMVVNGRLDISNVGTIVGTINARGDVATSDAGVGSGPGTILFDGAGAQVLSATNGGQVPSVRIDKTLGKLSFGAAPIGVTGDWTYEKGSVDVSGSTIAFQGYGSRVVDAGAGPRMAFNHVEISKGSGDTLAIANRLDVDGDLTINSIGTLTATPGAITVARNLVSNDTSVGGAADITMDSAADAVIRGGDFPNGGIIIAKGSSAAVSASVLQPLDGPLSLNSLASLTGEFQVGRNVTTRSIGASGNADGSPVLVFKGNQAQTITYHRMTNPNNGVGLDARLPGVRFDKTGGSVKFVKGAGAVAPDALAVTGGWIVSDNNAAAIDLAGHDIAFILSGGYGHRTINTGPSAGFDGVEINAGSGAIVTIEAMVVNGQLTIAGASQINKAAIQARGDVVTRAGGSAVSGTSRIRFEGGANQSLTSNVAEGRLLGVEIAKSGGTLTVGAANILALTGGWIYTSGAVSAAGSTIKFVGADKLINSGDMVFGNVIVAVGSANFVDIVGEAEVAGTLTGAVFNVTGGKVRSGKFVQVS